MRTTHPKHALAVVTAVVILVFGGYTMAHAQESASLPPGVGQPLAEAGPILNAASDLGKSEIYTGITPCRVFDTRQQSGPLVDGGRSFDVSGNLTAQGGNSACGIPANATSIAINLTGISTGSTGFVRGWAAGGPQPSATLLNFGPAINVSNQVNIPLCANGPCPDAFTLRAWGSTHIVGDAVGYFTAPMYANINNSGTVRSNRSSGLVGVVKSSVGNYRVTFDRDLAECGVQASDLLFTELREVSVDHSGSTVFVSVKDFSGNPIDSTFWVSVTC